MTPGARRPRWPWTVEVALLAPTLAAGVGLARLTRAPTSAGVYLPVVAAVAAGLLVTAVVRRRAGAALSLLAGVAAVVLVTMWAVAPSATSFGVPTLHSFHVLGHRLWVAWHVTRATPTPVPAVAGVVSWMAIGAGAIAVCSRLAMGRGPRARHRWRAALPLAPGAALFSYAALFSSDSGRAGATAAFVAGALVFALAADAAATSGVVSGARGTTVHTLLTGTVIVAVGVMVPLGLGSAFSGMRLSAFPAVTQAAPGPLDGRYADLRDVVGGAFLLDNLGAVLHQGPNLLLFRARTPLATYWQVAALTTFDGTEWLPDPETAALAAGTPVQVGAPPVLPQPPATSTFTTQLDLANLQTNLLPVPPDTLSVRSTRLTEEAPVGVYLPDGSLFAPSFTVVAAAPSAVPASEALAVSGSQESAYLQLPSLPADVTALAHRIVGASTNPLEEARMLVAFFDGNGFHFSLTASDQGPDPLETFLFATRTGFCQQFAGAFAVLARVDGLPTRLAVGFTAGTPGPDDTYQVTEADAHVWPEVYLGPELGWISFEPTPSGDGPVRPSGVLTAAAPAGLSAGSSSTSVRAVRPGQVPRRSGSAAQGTTPARSSSSSAAAKARRHLGGASPWWIAVAVALVAVVLAVLRRPLRRALSAVRRRGMKPGAAVMADWRVAERALARRHLARRRNETLAEHARRVTPRIDEAADAYRQLAELASRAGYSVDPVSRRQCATARRLREETLYHLRRRRTGARR